MTENNKNFLPDDDNQQPQDQAMKSLADALKISFQLLSVLMVIFVALFLLTGIESIDEQEQGICKRFGKVVRVAKPGLVYNWPFPIGTIEKVPTQQQNMLVEDFWLYIPPRHRDTPLEKMPYDDKGLKPGLDGYLITADRYIVHVKFLCTYKISDPIQYLSISENPKRVLHIALRQAAIKAASSRTADAIISSNDFLNDIKVITQKRLNAIAGTKETQTPAIEIVRVILPNKTLKVQPVGVLPAYRAAQNAKNEKNAFIKSAIAQATEMTDVCGRKSFIQLAGEPWETDPRLIHERTISGMHLNEPYNLIGQVENLKARIISLRQKIEEEPGNVSLKKQMESAQKKLDDLDYIIQRVLDDPMTTGQVSAILAAAQSRYTQIVQTARTERLQFKKFLPEYQKSPGYFRTLLWLNTMNEILSQQTCYKLYVTVGEKGMVVNMPPDQNILKGFRDYIRKLKNQELEKKFEKEGQ